MNTSTIEKIIVCVCVIGVLVGVLIILGVIGDQSLGYLVLGIAIAATCGVVGLASFWALLNEKE